MKTNIILACFTVALATAAPAHATTTSQPAAAAPATADAKVNLFLGKLRDGKIADAYASVFAGTLMDKKQGEVENLIGQTETAFRYYGPIRDWEQVQENRVSANLLARTYLVRTHGSPVYFKFLLYNNGEGWLLANLYFTDRFDQSGL